MGSVEYHLKDGWKRLEVIRKNGIYAGKADIYIYSPDGNKFRSKKELLSYLTSNNLPYKVEELFTATDASGSNTTKANEKSKKGGASEKQQVSDSSSSHGKHKSQGSDSSGSAHGKHKSQVSESASSGHGKHKSQVSESASSGHGKHKSQVSDFGSSAHGKNKSQASDTSSSAHNKHKPHVSESASSTQSKHQPQVTDSAGGNASTGNSQPAPSQKTAAASSSQKTVAPGPSSPGPGAHVMTTPHPGTFNILKERLRSAGSSGSGKDVPANVSPFIQTSQGNPSFVPQKLGKSNADARTPKPPKAPEKPLMPYMRYSRKVWELVKIQNPDLKLWEIGKIIGQQWRDLPDDMKAEFIEEYEAEKVEYEKALRIYYSSPAYLAYVQAKNKAGPSGEENREAGERQEPKIHERKIDIQPAEDDDDGDNAYSVKHMAYARYMRNHRLMTDIFNETLVPEFRFVVTSVRLQILRRQVCSLKMHQIKLESELEQAEEKFQVKKRRIIERCDYFEEEMKKYSGPVVDDETFEKMVQREYEILKQELMNKAASGSTPSSTITAPPDESGISQTEEMNEYKNQEKESQEPAAAAAAAAAVPTPSVSVKMEIDMPATVIPATETILIDNYSGVGYYPPAQQGHYPVQPLNVTVPSQPQFQYSYFSQPGFYTQYQPASCHPGGYGYFQYPSYSRAQYFLTDPSVPQQVYGSGAAEYIIQNQQAPIESQPQNATQCLPQSEQAPAGPMQPSGQQEWEKMDVAKTE